MQRVRHRRKERHDRRPAPGPTSRDPPRRRRARRLAALAARARAVLAACGSDAASSASPIEPLRRRPITVTDDSGHQVTLAKPATRVVSLAPSNTEMAFAIGAGDKLVAGTSYDDYPAAAKKLPKVGGFSTPSIEKIVSFQPDLVLATGGIQAPLRSKLENLGVKVFVVNPSTFDGVYTDLTDLGKLMGASAQATKVVDTMKQRAAAIEQKVAGLPKPTVFVEIYSKPLMTAGTGTYIDNMVALAGGTNIGDAAGSGYPTFSEEVLFKDDPARLHRHHRQHAEPGPDRQAQRLRRAAGRQERARVRHRPELPRPPRPAPDRRARAARRGDPSRGVRLAVARGLGDAVTSPAHEPARPRHAESAPRLPESQATATARGRRGPAGPSARAGPASPWRSASRWPVWSSRCRSGRPRCRWGSSGTTCWPGLARTPQTASSSGRSACRASCSPFWWAARWPSPGVILQDLFLNPLTDPYVTGVSSGAALGATIAIVLGLASGLWLTGLALVGGLGTLLLVWTAARRRGRIDVYVLLLAGVTASYLLSAVITVLMIHANDDLGAILYWLLGSFSGRTWTDVETALFAVPFMIVPLFFTREMNILLQGEKRALELGVDVERTKAVLVVTAGDPHRHRRLGVGHHRLRRPHHPAPRAAAGRAQPPPPAAALDAHGRRAAERGRPAGRTLVAPTEMPGRRGHHLHRRAGVRVPAAARAGGHERRRAVRPAGPARRERRAARRRRTRESTRARRGPRGVLCLRRRAARAQARCRSTVAPGDFVGVVGPNGSGKSTLLDLIDGVLAPVAGAVLVNGRPTREYRRRDIAREVALVPQHFALEFDLTVREVVEMGAYCRGADCSPASAAARGARPARHRRACRAPLPRALGRREADGRARPGARAERRRAAARRAGVEPRRLAPARPLRAAQAS